MIKTIRQDLSRAIVFQTAWCGTRISARSSMSYQITLVLENLNTHKTEQWTRENATSNSKQFSTEISPTPTVIFNKSLTCSLDPDVWRKAIYIKPIQHTHDESSLSQKHRHNSIAQQGPISENVTWKLGGFEVYTQILLDCRRPPSQYDGQMYCCLAIGTNQAVDLENMHCIIIQGSTLNSILTVYYTHTHTHARARTHAHTHTHTHIYI